MIVNPGFRNTNFTEESWGSNYYEYRRKWDNNPLNNIVENGPINLDIEITNACNLRCPFCVREYMEDSIGFMSWGDYENIIKQGFDNGVMAAKLNWRGEPTLHKDLPEMVKLAKLYAYTEISINTNGTLLTKKLCEELVDAKLDRIIFSIESIRPDRYAKYRPPAKLDEVIENIKMLLRTRQEWDRKKPYVRVQKIDFPETRDERYTRFFQNLGVDSVAINTYKEKGKSDKLWRTKPCCQPWQRLFIAWDGNIYPCCEGQRFEPIGNIKEMSIHDAWKSDMMEMLREKHINNDADDIPQCRECWVTKGV